MLGIGPQGLVHAKHRLHQTLLLVSSLSGKKTNSPLNASIVLQHVQLCSDFGDSHSPVDARGLQADVTD